MSQRVRHIQAHSDMIGAHAIRNPVAVALGVA